MVNILRFCTSVSFSFQHLIELISNLLKYRGETYNKQICQTEGPMCALNAPCPGPRRRAAAGHDAGRPRASVGGRTLTNGRAPANGIEALPERFPEINDVIYDSANRLYGLPPSGGPNTSTPDDGACQRTDKTHKVSLTRRG